MRLVLMIIATIFVVFFFVMSIKGNKFDSYVESLNGDDYPLKELYGFGFAVQEMSLFKLQGSLYVKLTGQAKMLYEPMYTEYYAKLTVEEDV